MLFDKLLTLLCLIAKINCVNAEVNIPETKTKLAGVILSVWKDKGIFEYSMLSALEHLKDIDTYYVITPKPEAWLEGFGDKYGDRVRFVDEGIFPFQMADFTRVPFPNKGWYLQQMLKLYAGSVLNLTSYVLLDSDLIWYKDVYFLAKESEVDPSAQKSQEKGSLPPMYYSSGCQYHKTYHFTNAALGIPGLMTSPRLADSHRSGIVHHMPIHTPIAEEIFAIAERKYIENNATRTPLPFWGVVIEYLLSLHGKTRGTSYFSEYELYFQYIRRMHPETIVHRPLFFSNGPAPGLLFTARPREYKTGTVLEVNGRNAFSRVTGGFQKQMFMDDLMGFDYMGFHSYAKRRYSEVGGDDVHNLCLNVTKPNLSETITCAWNETEMKDAFMNSKYNVSPAERLKLLMANEGKSAELDTKSQRARCQHISQDLLQGCMCEMLKLH